MTFLFFCLSKKMDKEKFIAYANYYMIFKAFLNSVIIMCIISLIASKLDINSLILPIIFSIIYFPYTIIEVYLIMRKVNTYREVSGSLWDFCKNWIVGIILNTIGIWFIILINEYVKIDIFILLIYIYTLIFPWFQNYLYGFAVKGSQTMVYTNLLKEKYNLDCSTNMYVFEGEHNKNANAYVAGIFGKKRIMLSNYLIENFTEDEICAILCHEVCHCKNYDTEFNVMIINFISSILLALGYLFEILDMPIALGCVIVITVILTFILGLMAIRRAQEYRADRYVVDVTGDYKVFADAIEYTYELNYTMKKRSKLLVLFESHPQLDKRFRQLRKYHEMST